MAQLPPKIPPTMTQNWPPAFPPHQRMPSLTHIPPPIPSAASHQQPSWVDEFLDFTASRRGNHRRSMSDSVTFLEAPAVLEGRRNSSTVGLHGGGGGGARSHHRDDADNASNDDGGFDRLDDEQLMSMFSDDISAVAVPPPPTSTRDDSNPSSPNSDQNSNDKGEDDDNYKVTTASMSLDQQQPPSSYTKTEPADGVVETSCNNHNNAIHINGAEELRGGGGGDGDPPAQVNCNANTSDPNNDHSGAIDPKRVKRILANRQSAQRSRVRKLQYISELERSVAALQTEVSALSPRVAFLDHQRLILNVDNSALKQRIAALAQDKIFKDAHQEALKKEIERLRKIYEQQHMKKMADNGGPTTSDTNMPTCAGKEQLMA